MTPNNQDLDIYLLKIFLAVCKKSNMSQAAKEVGISQPAISNAIRKLEATFGTELFDRTERPLKLTPAGRTLKHRSESILLNLNQLQKAVKESSRNPEIDLRLGFSDSFSGTITPLLLHQLVPKVANLSAYTESTPKIIDKLMNDKIDIAIVTSSLVENKDVNSIFIFKERFVVVTPENLNLHISSLLDLNTALGDLPVIRFNDESLDSIQVERVLRQCQIFDHTRIEADTNASVLSLVRHSIGWTVMPPLGIWMAKEQANNIALHDILCATRSFYVLYKLPVYADLSKLIVRKSQEILRECLSEKIKQEMPALLNYISLQ